MTLTTDELAVATSCQIITSVRGEGLKCCVRQRRRAVFNSIGIPELIEFLFHFPMGEEAAHGNMTRDELRIELAERNVEAHRAAAGRVT